MVLNTFERDLEAAQQAYATLTNLKAEINCQLDACLRLLALDVRKRAASKGAVKNSAPIALSQSSAHTSGTQTSSDSVLFRKLREASRALKSRTHELAARQRLWERMPSPIGAQAGECAPFSLFPRRMNIDAAGKPCWSPRCPASIGSPSTRGSLMSRQIGGGASCPRPGPQRAAPTATQDDACAHAEGLSATSNLETTLCIHKAGSACTSSVEGAIGTHSGACSAAAPVRPAPARSPPLQPRPASARCHAASPAQRCRPQRPSPRLDRPQSAPAAHAPTLNTTQPSCGASADAVPDDGASAAACDGGPSSCAALCTGVTCKKHASADAVAADDVNGACWHLQGVSLSSSSGPSRAPAAPRCASASERWKLDVGSSAGRVKGSAPMLLEERLRSLEATCSANEHGVWALHHGLAFSDDGGSALWLPSACAPELGDPSVKAAGAHGHSNTRALFGLLPLLLKNYAEGNRAKLRGGSAETETPAGVVEADASHESVAARLQGLLLLLSSPGAHDSAQEISSKVRASLPLWLPQAYTSRLLWVPPGQRSLFSADDGGSRGQHSVSSETAAGFVPAELFRSGQGATERPRGAEALQAGIAVESLHSGKASFVRDASAHPLFDAGVDAGVTRGGALLSVPLLDAAGAAIGVWQLSFGAHAGLQQADVALMDVAAHWLRAQLYSSRERAGSIAHALLSPMRAQLMHAATLSATEGSSADAASADAHQGAFWLLSAARAACARAGEEECRLPILLLPLLTASLPAVSSATCWRMDANELVEILSCTRDEVEDARCAETGPAQLPLPAVPVRASLSASHHPAVSSAKTNAAQLAQVPSQRLEAGCSVSSPRQFTLCLPITVRKVSKQAGLADAHLECTDGESATKWASTLRGGTRCGADSETPARCSDDTRASPPPRRFVLQLTSRAGVVLGGATCFAASELVELFCSLRTLLSALEAPQPPSPLQQPLQPPLPSPPCALALNESAALGAARRAQSPLGARAKLRSERVVGLHRSKSRVSALQRRVQTVMNSVVSELSEEEQRYAGRVLAEVSFSLLKARTPLQVASAAGAACRRACGAVRAECWEWRPAEGVLTRIGEEPGLCSLRFARRGSSGATLLGELVLEGATVLLPDVRRQAGVLLEEPELMLEGDGRAPLHSFLASPLHAADGEVIGAMLLLNKRSAHAQDPASFNQMDAMILQSIAASVAGALCNFRIDQA